MMTQRRDCPCIPAAGRNAVIHAPNLIRPTLETIIPRVFVHELGHSLGLGDEYFGEPNEVNLPESSFDGSSNLTSLAAVRIPDPDHPQLLFTSKIVKWNWERIQAAGVLSQKLQVTSPTTYDAILCQGHARPFTQNQEVRLRRRQWGVPLSQVADLGGIFKIESIAGDRLTLRLTTPGGAFDPATIGEGSIVYLPVKADRPSLSEPYARMIAPSIAEQIDKRNKPLTKWPRSAQEIYAEFKKNGALQLPETDLPGNWSSRANERIVGLYESGGHFAQGTFHPAGGCKMRAHEITWGFCPVCRYAIVDFVDPTWHGVNDGDYEDEYPG
jgi:hypothetical protein